MAAKKYKVTKEQLLRPLRDHFTEADRRPIRRRDREDGRRFREHLKNLGKKEKTSP